MSQFEGLTPQWSNNMNAITNPTAQDDNSKGYGLGSLWLNGQNLFICLDGQNNAAVWKGFMFTP